MQGEIESHQLREEIERLRSRAAILEQAAQAAGTQITAEFQGGGLS